MADIINLRQWKKRKARADKAEQADKNRAASSVPGKVKKAVRKQRDKELSRLEGKKLEKKDETGQDRNDS